ncbi:P-loop containing nucleoside triphosphate hydrolase protein [Lophiostoma macrostomum CBS 122681]|uniref:P-loop containing nucleoside triphosphate hydrolase protein n=1 Tax=Lophiostoma macrostomum CBS 122681 TaxID=1314788 RepID=A0A6A6TJM1_9PLEO|nr:P-loop containing nucleoside triphosphate hydrolase protein [Lophiostoma macrostomum CBS 122681]
MTEKDTSKEDAVNGDTHNIKKVDGETEESDKVNGETKDTKKEEEEDVADEDVGQTCELRVRQKRYNRSGEEENVVVDNLRVSRHGEDKKYAVVVKQEFTEQNRLEKEILTINSEHILEAFRTVIGSYPTVAADFSEPFDMEGPFAMLYHYWDELDEYRNDREDGMARDHLNVLFSFMESTMAAEKKKCETQIKKGQIDYSRLWAIYKPGETVIRYEHGHPWLLKCVKTAYEECPKGRWLEVHCVFTDYDGTDVGEAKHQVDLHQKRYFASEHPANIKDLPIYPRRYVEEGPDLEERLAERGEHFLTLRGVNVQTYDGPAAYAKEPPMGYFNPEMAEFDPIWWPYKETGRVVIDRKTFQEDKELSAVGISATSSDVDKTLCPPFVHGFSLAIKEWCRFYLPYVRDVAWDNKSIDSLVMQEDHKKLLQALVSSHSFPENPRDQTMQKGKGLVILLHGSPGSGKTLTAECCAEITGKALLSTSLAELNKENCAWYFEHRLKEVLQYATMWKAVVLFDEADVFLEARKDDVADAEQRNSLVAVFLKHLEYFSGIVFLTTNRVHVFDDAMKSRIHLALGYNPPEEQIRKLLWTKSLKAACHGKINTEIDRAIDTLVKIKMNGREIANALNTALTLARFEGNSLQLKHIETVLNIRDEFDLGLKRMVSHSKGAAMSPLVRRGSMLGAMVEESDEA